MIGTEKGMFGPKPKGITHMQWGAPQKLHKGMGHAPPVQMKRHLWRWGVPKKVIEGVDTYQIWKAKCCCLQ